MWKRRLQVCAVGVLIVLGSVDLLALGSFRDDGWAQDEAGAQAFVGPGNEPLQPTERVILVEEFTSWNSIPCAAYNPYLYAAIENFGYDQVAPGFIHVWWPPPVNDPFYLSTLEDSVARVNFYDNASAPDMYIDGVDYPQYPIQYQIESYFENQLDRGPGVSIETKATLNTTGNTGTVSAYVEALGPLSGTDYRLMFYLWENNVTRFGSGANGETEFKWAVWEMLPDANGTWVNLSSEGDFAVVTQNFTLDPSWDINELGITVFVQDNATKKVEQAHVERFEAPYVTLINPEPMTPSQVYAGTITIDWLATDLQDSDSELDITIEYSPNGGFTWFTLVSGVDNNSPPYMWDTVAAGVPDGPNYKLRITAVDNDGNVGSGMLSQSIYPFSIDNTGNDVWYLQIQSSHLPPNLDLDVKPFEPTQQEVSVPVTGPGDFAVQTWASEYAAPSDVDLQGDWVFRIYAKASSNVTDGRLYANVYGDNGTGTRPIFTTGLDDEPVSMFLNYHEFHWVYNVPADTTLYGGERVLVEIVLNATSGSPAQSFLANTDIPVIGNITNDYTYTHASDNQDEILEEVSNLNATMAQALNANFAWGFWGWTVVDMGGGAGPASTWVNDNPGGRIANPPLADPFAIVDSAFHGYYEMDEQLISPTMDLSYSSVVTLEFDQYYLDDPFQGENATVDVRSNLTGGAWVTVLDQSGNTTNNSEHMFLNISSIAAGASDVEVRFYYHNAWNASWWIIDNVVVMADITTAIMEHKWTIDVLGGQPPYEFSVEAARMLFGENFQFAYSLDNETFTDTALVNRFWDTVYTYALPNDISGTVYIRTMDVDRISGWNWGARLNVDAMSINCGPARLFVGLDYYMTPSAVEPSFTYRQIEHVCVMDSPGGSGANVTDHNMTTDDTLTVWSCGFDSDWNYVTDVLCNWTNTLNSQTANWSTTFTFDPTEPGNGTITAHFGNMTQDSTGLITVFPGALTHLCIQDAPDGTGSNVTDVLMTADDTLTLYAIGYDAEWNVAGPINCTWFTTGTLDNQNVIAPVFTFDPVTAPSSGTIAAVSVATSDTDYTGIITVIAGALANLCIMDQPGGSIIPGVNITNVTMSVGDDLRCYAVGYDSDWNYVSNVLANWSNDITSQTSTLTSTFLFSPTIPGSGFIHAEFNSSVNDSAGLITVNTGPLFRIYIRDAPGGGGNVVEAMTMTTDDTLHLWAAGYDEYGNYLADLDCDWTTTGTLDSQSATGVNNFTFDPVTAPTSGLIQATYGGVSGSAGVISVIPGALDRVVIMSLPGGAGSEVLDVVLVLGQSLTVYSVGYDSEGNLIGDIPCNWTTTGTLNSTVGMMTSSFTFRPAAAGENGTIVADFNLTLGDETGTITVIDTQIDYLRIEYANGTEIGNHAMTTADTLECWAVAYNYTVGRIGFFNVNWTTTGFLDLQTSFFTQSFTFEPHSAGTVGTIQITALGLSDSTGMIIVGVGPLAHICIHDAAGGAGANVTTHTMTTDETFTVYCVGYDADWNLIGDINANWSNTLNPQVAISIYRFTFDPDTVGTGMIIAEFNTTIGDTTGTITVIAGALATLQIRDGPGGGGSVVGDVTMTTDDTLHLWSAGYDAEGNYIGDVLCNWTTTDSLDLEIAWNANNFTFEPVTANTQGYIRAGRGFFGFVSTGLITVGHGALRSLVIRDGPGNTGIEVNYRMLLPNQPLVLYSAGYDADGNYIGDVPSNWTTTGSLNYTTSTMTSSFTFVPAVSGESGNIVATFNVTVFDSTGLIYVPDYGVDYIRITDNTATEIMDHTMTADQTFSVWAMGYNNTIGAVGLVSVDWTTTPGLDLQTSSGTWSFTFDPHTAWTSGTIEAVYGSLWDTTGLISVLPGQMAHLCIHDSPGGFGANITGHFMTTSEYLDCWAVGYDAEWNFVSDALCSWTTTGTLDPQTGMGVNFTFDPATAPTQGTIYAFHASSGLETETGNITVVYPPLAHLCIQYAPGGTGANVTDHNMTTDDTLTVWAVGYDAAWIYIYDVAANWTNTLNPQTSTMTTGFTLDPSTPATGVITATFSPLMSDDTGLITVVAGALAQIILRDAPGGAGSEVGDVAMTTDDTLTLWSAGYDSESNYIADVVCAFWYSNGTLDSHTAVSTNTLTFDPWTASTSGYITVVEGAFEDSTGLITVGAGALHHVLILDAPGGSGTEVGDVLMISGQSIWLYSAGYDADGNFLGDQACDWSTTGTLTGTFSPGPTGQASVLFTATSAGGTSGTVVADPLTATTDYTGLITVTSWHIDYIVIEDGAGSEVMTHTMDASQTFTVWAMGYNLSYGLIGPVNANWSTTGTLDYQTLTTSQWFTFDPHSAPTSGTIEAMLDGLADATGLITVTPGPVAFICVQDMPGGAGVNVTTHTMNTAETLTVYAIGFDAEWNIVGDTPANWTNTLNAQTSTMTTSFTLIQPAPANGTITATFNPIIHDSTGLITVLAPSIYNIDLTGVPANTWVLISFPIDATGDVMLILDDATWGDGGTAWDYVQWYDPLDILDHWKTFCIFKPASLNDLPQINNMMGLWVHITANGGDEYLTVGDGQYPSGNVTIDLWAGWNLVGYPSSIPALASDALPPEVDMVSVYDPAQPYMIRDETDLGIVTMEEGKAYWVHATADTSWIVSSIPPSQPVIDSATTPEKATTEPEDTQPLAFEPVWEMGDLQTDITVDEAPGPDLQAIPIFLLLLAMGLLWRRRLSRRA